MCGYYYREWCLWNYDDDFRVYKRCLHCLGSQVVGAKGTVTTLERLVTTICATERLGNERELENFTKSVKENGMCLVFVRWY